MPETGLEARADLLVVTWPDGATSSYPTIWLRDNCPSAWHPQTRERVLDLLSLSDCPVLKSAEREGDAIRLAYRDGHNSLMPLAMLDLHRPGRPASDPAKVEPQLWRSELRAQDVPRFAAARLLADDGVFEEWLRQTARFGLSVVDGLDERIEAGAEVAQRIGFLRMTNFGIDFEVVNMPDPNNLAYTSLALPLHSDLPNQEVPPGYQFLHCLANEASGGGSIFADGFALAADLREQDPAAFKLLSEVAIPYRFHDKEYDIRIHEPVIALDRTGELVEVRFNAHIAAAFDMPADEMPRYYQAYRAFMQMTRDPKYRLSFKLEAGEMVAFDNRRVLHGREAFDPNSGYRHLHGCYVDRGEFHSRLRLLARARQIA